MTNLSMLPANEPRRREIRVFISSTFRDMQAEREELVKRVFPQIRKLCESRGVTWGEVDLSWGIPDEEKAEGKVLPICLAEIHRCRPYFIGILGERYGWLPHEIPQALIDEQPWLAESRERSVTELEILHGVINNREMADHAFFYFRDPAYLEHLPAGANPEDFRSENASAAVRLRDLKERIRASGLPVRENYADPRALGERVREDLSQVIDRLYPEGSQPGQLDLEAAEHEAFARSRTGVYIGREDYSRAMDQQASLDGPPLVVLGESGSGKSALLANWAASWRTRHPEMVEANSPLRLVNAYPELKVKSVFGGITLRRLAHLLQSTGHFEEALKLRKRSTKMWQGVARHGDGASGDLADALHEEAAARVMAGDWSKATSLYREEERLRRDAGDRTGLALCLCARAGILISQGRLDEALQLVEEAERIQRQVGGPLGQPLNLRGLILLAQGHPDQAMGLFQQEELIWRKTRDTKCVAGALGNQGLVLRQRKDLDGAMALHKQEEQLYREIGFRDGLARCLGYQAVVLLEQHRPEEALGLFKEQERLCREMKYAEGLADCLGNQAQYFLEQRRFDAAAPLLEEREQICRRLGDQRGLGRCLNDRAQVQAERGDLIGSMALLKEQEQICKAMGDFGWLETCNRNQETILTMLGPGQITHKRAQPTDVAVSVFIPHPTADAERDARANVRYRQELAEWNALPWWKRLTGRKPKPPPGVLA
jgi:tetratricopeptide (TPR) repeat protein